MLVGVAVAVVVILRHYHASTGQELGQVSCDWLRAGHVTTVTASDWLTAGHVTTVTASDWWTAGHVTTVTASDWLLQGSSSNASSALIVATIYFYFAAGPYVGNYKLRHFL